MGSPGRQQLFHFLSGLPRSGSTLLGAILSENPEIYVTPTSPLFPLLFHVDQAWRNIEEARAGSHPAQLGNINHGIICSIYRHIERPIIVDKHRAWPRNIPAITSTFGCEPKIICTVRDLTEILASYLLLLRKTSDNFIDQQLSANSLPITDENRCGYLWERMIQDPWISLKQGFEHFPRCIHLVEYDELIARPKETIESVYQFLKLKPFSHEFGHITHLTPENDQVWGIPGLHVIRSKLGRTSPPSIETLGSVLHARYSQMGVEFWRRRSSS